MYRIVCVALAVVAAVALPSPLSGSADDRLYGDDCSQWCFNGTDVLQPEVFGASNTYCPDSRGCDWTWRVSVAPCSLSLLDFEADVGPDETPFSEIDSASSGSLQFYCSQSDGGVVLELRPHGGAPIMTWHYRAVTCVELLSNFAAREAAFTEHEVGVSLGGNDWFANGATRLEDKEVDCHRTEAIQEDMEPCKQCFRGIEEPTLPADGWEDVCGERAATCQVEWHFCYDACTQSTSKASMNVGGQSLKDVAHIKNLNVQCQSAHGRTVLALTDVESIDALDAGQANVYLAWEYRDVACDALMQAPRRHALFVQRHFALQRPQQTFDDGSVKVASMLAMLNLQTGGLDERIWLGTGSDQSVFSESANNLSDTEIGLIVGLAVAGGLCILGWVLVFLLWRRGTSAGEGLSFRSLVPIPSGVGGVIHADPVAAEDMWTAKSPLSSNAQGDVEEHSEEDKRTQLKATIARIEHEANTDTSYLYTDHVEQREKDAQRESQKAAAQRELDRMDGKNE